MLLYWLHMNIVYYIGPLHHMECISCGVYITNDTKQSLEGTGGLYYNKGRVYMFRAAVIFNVMMIHQIQWKHGGHKDVLSAYILPPLRLCNVYYYSWTELA